MIFKENTEYSNQTGGQKKTYKYLIEEAHAVS